MSDYYKAQEVTAISLHHMIDTTELTHLSLPERKALVDEIARVIPAGNVPSMVAAGLMQAPGRVVSDLDNRRNLTLLMQGMQTFLDKAIYKTFFGGPAAVLSAYQMLLKLAGKDPAQSFPEGTWQFYVEFGLREDSGRHACETTGFQAALAREGLRLEPAEEMACWVAASAWLLTRYNALLENEWLERVQLRHYATITEDEKVAANWIKCRPYHTPPDYTEDYTVYRRMQFTEFYDRALDRLDRRTRRRIEESWDQPIIKKQHAFDLIAYQQQMTIRAMLNPTEYNDGRIHLPGDKLTVGVIEDGRYYMVGASSDHRPLSVSDARHICSSILRDKPSVGVAALDKLLANAHRRDQPTLRRLIAEEARPDFEALRRAPILINWDRADADQPLSLIRTGRRGIGDHPMTIFRTNQSMVFDLSHIFFDGPWGIAVAEILTSHATRLARQLAAQPRPVYKSVALRALNLSASAELRSTANAAHLPSEASAETTLALLEPIQKMRHSLQKRNDDLRLTVNDILILYRAVFGQCYEASPEVQAALIALEASPDAKVRQAASLARASIETAQQANPALLIPMDASALNPRERLYPTTFRNPFTDLLAEHRKTLATLEQHSRANLMSRPRAWAAFEQTRRDYLAIFGIFGKLMSKYKDVTMQGESVSTSTIKLLAGLPNSVRRMLDELPSHFDVVNDAIKGQEVFSNVGRVNDSSSLRRFVTAKDDNEKKVLAWGIMTDAAGVMHISLRDFRPHVAPLIKVKQGELAQQIAQDYVDAYARTLNQFVSEVLRIILVRRDATTPYPISTQHQGQ